ncbi:MAG TPA: hypothetical protein VEC16_04410 [Alphaproteobacteria bacterium]|nr:hypothetical protein [Alphaproteobacteria bacterium]
MVLKRNTEKRNYIELSICLILLICLITWPLILNMKGFVLPQVYPDISHSDSLYHIGKFSEQKEFIDQGQAVIIVDSGDVSQIYIAFGVIVSEYFGLNPVATHNLYFMLVLFMSGLFMYLLAKELLKDHYISMFAAFLYMTAYYIPYAYYWGHSNTIQIQWIPLVFLLIEKILKNPTWKNGLALGIIGWLQVMSSSYNLIHLTVLVPIYLIFRHFTYAKIKFKKIWKPFTLAAITAIILSLPYLIKRIQIESTLRTIEENSRDYWRLDSLTELININYHLYIGTVQLALTSIAAYLLFKYKEYRNFISYALLAVFTIICMIGPIGWYMPYYWLYHIWPYFDRLRVPDRMFPFAIMSIALLASLALAHFTNNTYWKSRRWLAVLILMIFIIVTQILVSPWIGNLHVYFVN